MEEIYKRFLAHIPAGGKILDAGAGAGRDTIAFKAMGYDVTAIDIAPQHPWILPLAIEDMRYKEKFDGVWACASLIGMSGREYRDCMESIYKALKPAGMLYTCFKVPALDISNCPAAEYWISKDTTGRDITWHNYILRKN